MKNIPCRIRLLFLLLLCSVFSAVAQNDLRKFYIVNFEEKPFDLTANDTRYKIEDGNGALFSIIKLVAATPDDDLTAYHFDFGLCEDREKTVNGERWIYVQRNAMHVTITREGFQPVKSELNLTVQEGKVYEMVLKAAPKVVYKQMVQFNITPARAGATVMYKSYGPDSHMEQFGVTDETGSVARNLELGQYVYTIYLENYHPSEGFLTLNQKNGKYIENIELRPNFSNITLKADDGVEIYIDGEKRGTGSWSGPLKAGEYSVECRKDKHKSVVETIEVKESMDRVIPLKSPTPITGTLSITSSPLGANIKIDGKDYGVTAQNIDGLIIGKHEVEISKANYKSEKAFVEVRENEITEYNATLSNIASMVINSSPMGATLYVNKKYIGETPCVMQVASGDYDIYLHKNKYRDIRKRVHLDSSNPNVRFALKRQYQQKWGGYAQLTGSFGSLMGIGGNVGCYLYNVNVEGYGIWGLGSENVYMNYDDKHSTSHTLKASTFGGKVGYGVILGARFRLTPQVGIGAVKLSGDGINTSAVTASGGLRMECIAVKHFGISVTPEYRLALKKNQLFEEITRFSSKAQGWCNGFNVNVGLYFSF